MNSRSTSHKLHTRMHAIHTSCNHIIFALHLQSATYKAPFFTTWFVTNWTMLFFPLYLISRLGVGRCESPSDILSESIRDFREKGFTAVRFLTRCSFFCLLWVGTNYMYIRSLRILLATDVMALFATNVSSVYLLSWVILHEQFVGIRVGFNIFGRMAQIVVYNKSRIGCY